MDLKPALDEQTLDKRLLSDFAKYANKDFANALADLLPAKLIRIMQSHLIYRDNNGVWKNEDDDTILANLSPMMMKQMQFQQGLQPGNMMSPTVSG